MLDLTPQKKVFLDSMKEAKEKGIGYQDLEGESFTGRKIQIKGKELLNFGNCCYLGLETHPKIKQGVIEATEKYGSLLSNSRSYFSSSLYSEFDKYLDKIFPGSYQVVTTTTTLGHCALLPVMIEREDVIIIDQFAHNSLCMAANLCKAQGTKILPARHDNMERLAEMIKREKKRGAKNIWYLGDGIYSMQGDFIDIQGLMQLLDEHEDFYAYIDDAHGMSWTGKNGAGYVLGRHGMHSKMIVAVSMCKSFAAFGGVIIFPNKDWAERVRFLGQTLIFSAPISPPILGAAIASAKIHLSPELETMQRELADKISYFRENCLNRGINLKTKHETPIQFIEIGDNSAVYDVIRELVSRGIFVTAAAYPAMPKKHGGVRISLTRHMKIEDIDYLLDQLEELTVDKSTETVGFEDAKAPRERVA